LYHTFWHKESTFFAHVDENKFWLRRRKRKKVLFLKRRDVKMFEQFKTIDESNTFEILDNGFILRVSGRGVDGDWLRKAFVFPELADFLEAVEELTEKEVSG
jgi:hypothetical protein